MSVLDQQRSSEFKDIMNTKPSRLWAAAVSAMIAALLMAMLMMASSARAAFEISEFSGSATDSAGVRSTQAAAHPDVETVIKFATKFDDLGNLIPVGNMKQISVELPPGLVGNPRATPRCTAEQLFGSTTIGAPQCQADTQVGVASLDLAFGGPTPLVFSGVPVYNMEVPKGVPGRFAFNLLGVIINLDATIRTGGDYGITASTTGISQGLPTIGTSIKLWGVPADPIHDAQRQGPDNALGQSSTAPRVPFMSSPTTCSTKPLVTSMMAASWQEPDNVRTASFDSDSTGPLLVTGCDRVPFTPSFDVSTQAPAVRGAPTGIAVDLAVPQNQNPLGLASAHLKKSVVTLPEGMVVNPSSAQGLGSCTPAQIDIKGASSPACPDSSKIGSIDLDTPLLDAPLNGGIYLASQGANPFGTTLAMYLVAEGSGVVLKLPGRIDPDLKTGRLTVTFDDNPQLPFSKLSLRFKTGPRAALSLPTTCGAATATAVLAPWSGTTPVALSSSFEVSADGHGAPCPPLGFSPRFSAGTRNPSAGRDSSFTLGFSRTDDDQQLAGVSVEMPKGLLGRIAGVTQCATAAAEAGTCGEGSQLGSVTTSAGAGSNPFSLPGRAYLTGPYKGGPFGLSIVVPAVAGPLDLGTVVVRAAITVDPITAQLRVVSDPFPTILQGIPLQVRSVRVDVDRPGFMFNPTDCTAGQIAASLVSVSNAVAPVSSRFQVGDCSSLALKPTLGLTLSGKGQSTDGGHPAVSAIVRQPAGQANLKKVRVALPLSLALDPDNAASDGLCSFVEGSKPDPQCPASSVVGTATAVSPVLAQPLSGPVYFTKNERKDPKSGRSIKTTPKLVIPLVGENGVKLTLTGTSTVVDDQLVTTFDNIPDAPVTSFKMDISGGKKGILVVSATDICKATQVADQQIDGQNNKNADADVFIQTPNCPLKVLSKKVGKRSVAIKVGGLSAGKVTITGHGIKKTTKTITKSTVATITAKRSQGTPGKVTVTFDPTGPAKARKTTK
jgi:hypothetical protein